MGLNALVLNGRQLGGRKVGGRGGRGPSSASVIGGHRALCTYEEKLGRESRTSSRTVPCCKEPT